MQTQELAGDQLDYLDPHGQVNLDKLSQGKPTDLVQKLKKQQLTNLSLTDEVTLQSLTALIFSDLESKLDKASFPAFLNYLATQKHSSLINYQIRLVNSFIEFQRQKKEEQELLNAEEEKKEQQRIAKLKEELEDFEKNNQKAYPKSDEPQDDSETEIPQDPSQNEEPQHLEDQDYITPEISHPRMIEGGKKK